jgi:hypothetical protein
MPRRSNAVVWLLLAFSLQISGQAEEAVPKQPEKANEITGDLVGSLTDPLGQIVYAGRAAVFLCDAATGMPIDRESKRPITPSSHDPTLEHMWVAETRERGDFRFDQVPVGKYRLVAQSWSGTQGFPGFEANRHPSVFVILHGVAEDVVIEAGKQTQAFPRQLGNHVLHIRNDPEEPHALLLISLKPTCGDAILGPYGWGREFCRNLIGVTQMEVPHVTIIGLPADRAIHVGLMNYDNSPGCGSGSYAPGQREGQLRIVAAWSNGHKDPPPGLAKLTDYLEKNQIEISTFLNQANAEATAKPQDAQRILLDAMVADNDRMVTVSGLGQRRLADVLAAYSYIRLRKSKR